MWCGRSCSETSTGNYCWGWRQTIDSPTPHLLGQWPHYAQTFWKRGGGNNPIRCAITLTTNPMIVKDAELIIENLMHYLPANSMRVMISLVRYNRTSGWLIAASTSGSFIRALKSMVGAKTAFICSLTFRSPSRSEGGSACTDTHHFEAIIIERVRRASLGWKGLEGADTLLDPTEQSDSRVCRCWW